MEYNRELAFISNFKELIKNIIEPGTIDKMIDIGGSDGLLTKLVSEYLECTNYIIGESNNIFQKYQSNPNVKYINTTDGIDEDNVDLVMCLHSLHHITDCKRMIYNINRSLKTNGFLIIKEHDVGNRYLVSLLDLYHLDYYKDECKDLDTFKEAVKSLKYYKRIELNKVLLSAGFHLISLSESAGTQRIYYECWVKNKDVEFDDIIEPEEISSHYRLCTDTIHDWYYDYMKEKHRYKLSFELKYKLNHTFSLVEFFNI